MKRVISVVAGVLIIISGAGIATGQNIGWTPGFAGASVLESFPGLGSFDIGGVRLTASARVGYQWIGLNFNLPTPSRLTLLQRYWYAPIDIQLSDAHVWVGSAGVEGQLTPWLSLFADAEANAKRNAVAVTSEEPLHLYRGGAAAYRWNASGLEWWALEGGVAVNPVEGAALVAGLRREHLSFGLDNPRDDRGYPINQVYSFPPRLITMSDAADFQLKLWVPYVALRVIGTNYRGSLSWTPFVRAAVKIPDYFVHTDVTPGVVSSWEGDAWQYSMFQKGELFEGRFDYDVRFISNLFINVWAKGSWLKVRGTGNLDQDQSYSVWYPNWSYTSFRTDHQSATATLSRSLTAVGLAFKLEF